MALRTANCPNCGGTVSFKADSSLLSVCPYCSGAVARVGGDIGELEILGQVAPLADLGSPLELGARGSDKDTELVLLGRVQYDHGAGPWNEWYAVFDDGRWGFVAEAQGRVYLTFEAEGAGLPEWDEAEVGEKVAINGRFHTIVEKQVGKIVSSEGELPFAARPGAEIRYLDVEGSKGSFATLDYSESLTEPVIYAGQQLRYEDLFSRQVLKEVEPGAAAASVALHCPNCGSSVELKAPDQAQQVTCGSCDALLDCKKGSELFLLASNTPRLEQAVLPLGATGTLDDMTVEVYARLQKSVTAWDERYVWIEYLLRTADRQWWWLSCSEGHWNLSKPVSAGEVTVQRRAARYRDERFSEFSTGSATVEALDGELYWKVRVGDVVGSVDYVKPPQMLSAERALAEVSYSLGRYVEVSEMSAGFGAGVSWPKPRGIAPHQPNPHRANLKKMWGFAKVLVILLVAVAGAFQVWGGTEGVASSSQAFTPKTPFKPGSGFQKSMGAELEPIRFELSRRGHVAVDVSAELAGGAIYTAGTLAREDGKGTRLVEMTATPSDPNGRYGSRRRKHFGELEPGSYVLRLRPTWSGYTAPPGVVHVQVTAHDFLLGHFLAAFFALWVLPLIEAYRMFRFEKRRWLESDHAD